MHPPLLSPFTCRFSLATVIHSCDNDKLQQMNNKIVIVDIKQSYPFGFGSLHPTQNTLQARKTVSFHNNPRFIIKEKVRVLKSLGFQHLVGLLSASEQDSHLYLMFQYVHRQFDPSAQSSIIASLRQQLYELSQNLVFHCIDHDFQLSNIGLDQKNNLKYYLGIEFKIDRNLHRQKTAESYQQAINALFEGISEKYYVNVLSPDAKLKGIMTTGQTEKLKKLTSVEQKKIMKKSSIEAERNPGLGPGKRQDVRLTFDIKSQRLPSPDPGNCYEEHNDELKVVKLEQLGARIAKLKDYMKQATFKKPTSRAGLTHFTMKADSNDRILQENKIIGKPEFSKIQKKSVDIRDIRENKLLKPSKEQDIVFSKNVQGYDRQTKPKQSNQKPQLLIRSPQTLTDNKQKVMKAGSNSPQKKLQRLKTQQKRNEPPRQQPHTPQSEGCYKNFNFILKENERKQKEYKMLAESDKYCQEFMYFLQAQQIRNKEEQSHTNGQNNHFLTSQASSKEKAGKSVRFANQMARANNIAMEASDGVSELQNRVQNVIRHSLRLINNLKTRQTVHCQ